MIERLTFGIWGRIERSVALPAESLGVFRWVFGTYIILFDARWFAWLDQTPDAFFDPPIFSLAYLVGAFPPAPFLTVVDVIGLIALCLMTIGYRTRLSTLVALATYIVSTTFSYSHGKISHQVAILLVLSCMAVADWGRASPRRVAQGMALLAVAICFGFLAAGFEKARYWLTPDLGVSGILSWYYPRMDLDEPRLLAPLIPGIPLIFLKAADYAAVIMETSGFLALLLGRIPWRVWLLVLPCFHLTNALVLNITFPTQAVAYLAFVNLTLVSALRIHDSLGRRLRAAVGGLVVVATAWHVATRLAGGGSFYFLGRGPADMVNVDFIVGIGACILSIALIGWDLRTEVTEARMLHRRRRDLVPSRVA